MLLSRVHYPVHTLGYGVRAGIWTQGCTIQCAGCVARDTWAPDPGRDVPVSEIVEWVHSHPDIDGVTVSGGEPTDQPAALVELLTGLRSTVAKDADILCFTGRTLSEARRRVSALSELVDALVSGPYVRNRPTKHPLMGSANQRLSTWSELGNARYGRVDDSRARTLQVWRSDNTVRFVGIPADGELRQLTQTLLECEQFTTDLSWDAEP